MKTICYFFLLACLNVCLVLGVYHTCPVDKYTWEFGYTCIQAHYNTKDWDDARADCRKLGGDLLEVRSSEMQLFVQNHLKATGKEPAGYWIGATDRHHEDRWEWLNGEKTMRFSNWEKGQGPGQTGFFFSSGSLEDCAMIRPDAGYKWHDGPCAGGIAFHYAYLCEFHLATTTRQTMKPTSSKPATKISTTASPATVVTPTPTTLSSTMPNDTSTPSSPAASTHILASASSSKTASTTSPDTSTQMPSTSSSAISASTTSPVTSTQIPAQASSTNSASTASAPVSPKASTAVPSTSTSKPTTTTDSIGVVIGR